MISLSIIILNYKSWEYTEKCINSIRLFPPKKKYEIIVIDNDSMDGKLPIFQKKIKNVAFYVNKGNLGYASGCNYGAQKAIGKFLLFLNPDTEITSSPAIDSIVNYALADKNFGIASCRKIKPKNTLERELTFLNPWLTIGIFRAIYKFLNRNKLQIKFPESSDEWSAEWLTGSIFLISKSTYELVDGLSERDYWLYFEEMDLAHKIKKINKTITLLRNVEIKHQHGGSSRINPRTSAITKSEVMISRHVYISKFYFGINKISLHLFMALFNLFEVLLLLIIFSPILWTKKGKALVFLFKEIIYYYTRVIFTKNWRSKRLMRAEN